MDQNIAVGGSKLKFNLNDSSLEVFRGGNFGKGAFKGEGNPPLPPLHHIN